MAQTKRKRSTKHRGNAAGIVETRGRTGRKPTAAEMDPKVAARVKAKERKPSKADQPPTWRSALIKAPVMAVILFIFMTVLTKHVATAAVLAGVSLFAYVPMGYYTDSWAYNRRMRKKAEARKR